MMIEDDFKWMKDFRRRCSDGKTRRKCPMSITDYLRETIIYKRQTIPDEKYRKIHYRFYEENRTKLSQNLKRHAEIVDDGNMLAYYYIGYSLNKKKRWLIPKQIKSLSAEQQCKIDNDVNSVSLFEGERVTFKRKANCTYYCINKSEKQIVNKPSSGRYIKPHLRPFVILTGPPFLTLEQLISPTALAYFIFYPTARERCFDYKKLTGSMGERICRSVESIKKDGYSYHKTEKRFRETLKNRRKRKVNKWHSLCHENLRDYVYYDYSWDDELNQRTVRASKCEDDSESKYLIHTNISTKDIELLSLITCSHDNQKEIEKKRHSRRQKQSVKRICFKDTLQKENYICSIHNLVQIVSQKDDVENTNDSSAINKEKYICDNSHSNQDSKENLKPDKALIVTTDQLPLIREKTPQLFWHYNFHNPVYAHVIVCENFCLIPVDFTANTIKYHINASKHYSDIPTLDDITDVTDKAKHVSCNRSPYVHIIRGCLIDFETEMNKFLRTEMDKRTMEYSVVEDQQCPVCFDISTLMNLCANCNHFYCLNCWRNHVEVRINEMASPTCMSPKCKSLITLGNLYSFADFDKVNALKYKLAEAHLMKMGSIKCKSCLQLQFIEDENSPFVCSCGVKQCSRCFCEPHFPLSCQRYTHYFKRLHLSGFTDMNGGNLLRTITGKQCPFCHTVLNKLDGCNHVTCPCLKEFCWVCLTEWDNDHYRCPERNGDEMKVAVAAGDAYLEMMLRLRDQRLNFDRNKIGKKFWSALSCYIQNVYPDITLPNLLEELLILSEFLVAAYLYEETSDKYMLNSARKLISIMHHLLDACSLAHIQRNPTSQSLELLMQLCLKAVRYIKIICSKYSKISSASKALVK